jgi:hypothetical protein
MVSYTYTRIPSTGYEPGDAPKAHNQSKTISFIQFCNTYKHTNASTSQKHSQQDVQRQIELENEQIPKPATKQDPTEQSTKRNLSHAFNRHKTPEQRQFGTRISEFEIQSRSHKPKYLRHHHKYLDRGSLPVSTARFMSPTAKTRRTKLHSVPTSQVFVQIIFRPRATILVKPQSHNGNTATASLSLRRPHPYRSGAMRNILSLRGKLRGRLRVPLCSHISKYLIAPRQTPYPLHSTSHMISEHLIALRQILSLRGKVHGRLRVPLRSRISERV